MSVTHPSEDEEWLESKIETWIETYKKAMLTPVILRLIALKQPVSIQELHEELVTSTGWQITERGLYRTVKRLQDSGFLTSDYVSVPRTGAKRKELALASLGKKFLAGIDANLIDLASEETAD